MFVCCCCGCCCGVLTTAKRLPEPAAFFSTNYVAVADAAACGGCGRCLTRCQMDAIAIPDDHAVVSAAHCIGCGLCVPTCPDGALALQLLQRRRVPPANTAALYAQMYRERHGTLGLATAVGRRLLGVKV
jgi:Na+-translocating ferredoxin:NAD+ oxidoreductase RNF subunit RnfB